MIERRLYATVIVSWWIRVVIALNEALGSALAI